MDFFDIAESRIYDATRIGGAAKPSTAGAKRRGR